MGKYRYLARQKSRIKIKFEGCKNLRWEGGGVREGKGRRWGERK